MVKTLTEEEYQAIRRGVAERKLARQAQEALVESLGSPRSERFETVEAFMAWLNSPLNETV